MKQITIQEVHDKIVKRYKNKGQSAKAKEIEVIFNNIKNLYNNPNNNELAGTVYEDIVKTMQRLNPQVTRIFKSGFGTLTEFNINMILQAVATEISGTDRDLVEFKAGTDTVSGIFNEKDFLNPMVQKILQAAGTASQKYIKTKMGQLSKLYYLQDVMGKPDSKMMTYKITGNANAEMIKIYQVLKNTRFSDKAYTDYGEAAQDLGKLSGVKIGASNAARAITQVLSTLGYSKSSIIQYFYSNLITSKGTIRSKSKLEPNLKKHLQHLRFIYELTGGTNFNQSVQFLVWNEPSGNIVVASTYDLINKVLNNEINNYIQEDQYIIQFKDLKNF